MAAAVPSWFDDHCHLTGLDGEVADHVAAAAAHGVTRLELLVDEPELSRRRGEWEAARPAPAYTRGWYKLYIDTVLQADKGADLDFLVGKSSADVTRESH